MYNFLSFYRISCGGAGFEPVELKQRVACGSWGENV
jgi:hypothetical protein